MGNEQKPFVTEGEALAALRTGVGATGGVIIPGTAWTSLIIRDDYSSYLYGQAKAVRTTNLGVTVSQLQLDRTGSFWVENQAVDLTLEHVLFIVDKAVR